MATIYQHKQAFWTVKFSTSDIGDDTRRLLAKAAAELKKQEGVLIALSAGGRTVREPPEITLVVPHDSDLKLLTTEVENAVHKQKSLEHQKITLHPEVRFHAFSDNQLLHILNSVQIPDKADPSKVPADVRTPTPYRVDGVITHDDLTFSIQESRQNVFAKSEASLRDEFESLRKMFGDLALETKTSVAVVLMASEGVVTIGMQMWIEFVNTTITGSLITAIEPLISSIGGLRDLLDAVNVIAKPLASLNTYIASNILLFINEHSASVNLTNKSVSDGSHGFVVDNIGACHQPTAKSAKVYSSGLYLSLEVLPARHGGISISSSTSTSKAHFSSQANLHFALRAASSSSNSPNTGPESGIGLSLTANDITPPGGFSLGGYIARSSSNGSTNSVVVQSGENAQEVQTTARDSTNATDKATVGGSDPKYTAYGRRQDANGTTNYVLGRLFQNSK